MKIKENSVVKAKFTMTNEKDQILDSSNENGDLVYLHGGDMIFDKLEEALLGKSPGYNLTITLSPEDAYGERDEEDVIEAPLKDFEDSDKLKVGTEIEVSYEDDDSIDIMTILEIKDETIILDGNHPYAGMTIKIDLTVEDIREATEEEIEDKWVNDF